MIKSFTAALLAVSFIAAPAMAASKADEQPQGKPADYIKIVGVSKYNNNGN
ncbi:MULTISPECIES: hypothetical protein [unclassified Vibrio]|uniref:Uncharacterized protein n=1 Tax=Vibrio sp. HB236076 TaxID=3232307 RepID=A0AB39HKW0_9VIBR|nr:hypothetical protein [Vibrio sp. HB161653]MDP5253190.1 hypothetical protein [Vibrio sp. HB161653]